MMQVKDLQFTPEVKRVRVSETFALGGTFLSPGTVVITMKAPDGTRALALPRGTRDFRCRAIKKRLYLFPPAAPATPAQTATA